MQGRIILLNGTSSAGKSTLAQALRPSLEPGFCYYASDQLADGGFRPLTPIVRFEHRRRFFDGFHRSIACFAAAGIDLLVEHIVEEQGWWDDLDRLLRGFDTFWIGVHAPVEELARRERQRGDRAIGEHAYHLRTHSFCRYQLQVDSTSPLDETVDRIVKAWQNRRA